MPTGYQAISADNRVKYGTEVDRYAEHIFVDRYDDRTHFIFELLQNTEDALRRRVDQDGPRSAKFELAADRLTLSHFGRPFDEADVRGVCGIGEGTKGDSDIGGFGIGFKSVYAFTDRPEVHSGEEAFAIEGYVRPVAVPGVARASGETKIVLPLRATDQQAHEELVRGLRQVGPRAMLFLREIEEVSWLEPGGTSGTFLRSAPKILAPHVREVTVVGQETGKSDTDETWLVFEREVYNEIGEDVGFAEIAFLLSGSDGTQKRTVTPLPVSQLVVFFPTVVQTNLGFLIQGPFKTTPSRDNVPRSHRWNEHLVEVTAKLTVSSLRWLRDQALLDASVLNCLPLDPPQFPEGSMFWPVFDAVREALSSEPLLPRYGSGYVSAKEAKLGRTQELRELVSAEQLKLLYPDGTTSWLTGEITQDRTPALRSYVNRVLGVSEITPAPFVGKLTKEFLESQPDEWIRRLYEFLGGQAGSEVKWQLRTVPFVRLEDGTHVRAVDQGKPQAFLPGPNKTSFPTMRAAVCATPDILNFLRSQGLSEPDLVDDVLWNILPHYEKGSISVSDEEYSIHVQRILEAYGSASQEQRSRLTPRLATATFVMSVDIGDGEKYVSRPDEVYIAADRLKRLFDGVSEVRVVDDDYSCLRGEPVRALLEACGAVRYLRPIAASEELSPSERLQLRKKGGHEQTSGQRDRITDWTLLGLDELLEKLPSLSVDDRVQRARLLWESLSDMEERRGHGVFSGEYSWTHYGTYRIEFPAAFLRKLNRTAWVPGPDGELSPPSAAVFDALGWSTHPFLQSVIAFKPPVVEQLAKEVGLDPALLDMLKAYGITNPAALVALLPQLGARSPEAGAEPRQSTPSDRHFEALEVGQQGSGAEDGDNHGRDGEALPRLGGEARPLAINSTRVDSDDGTNVYDDARDLYGDGLVFGDPRPSGGSDDLADDDLPHPVRSQGNGQGTHAPLVGEVGGDGGLAEGKSMRAHAHSPARDPVAGNSDHASGRPFISYVGVTADEEEHDPDGLIAAERLKLESLATDLVVSLEPELQRTPPGNPGYDLYEADDVGRIRRWIEIKSMTGDLESRPVGLSRAQFECARKNGADYWLYIVEMAASDKPRIRKIRDPAGRARTFTFDRGWAQASE